MPARRSSKQLCRAKWYSEDSSSPGGTTLPSMSWSKIFNPLSVACATGKEKVHTTSQDSLAYLGIYSQSLETTRWIHLSCFHQVTSINRPPFLQPTSSKSICSSQPSPRPTALAHNGFFQDHCCKMSFSGQMLIPRSSQDHLNIPKIIIQLSVKISQDKSITQARAKQITPKHTHARTHTHTPKIKKNKNKMSE